MHVARAVEALRPHLLVVENVRGLLTSPAVAASAGDVERCPWCLGDDPTQRDLRALGAVLGTLAQLRYDAKWLVLRASDVGAPHHRARVFLTAWPSGDAGHPVANSPDLGHQWSRSARRGRFGPADGGDAPANTEGERWHQGLTESAARWWGPDPALGSGFTAALLTPEPGLVLPPAPSRTDPGGGSAGTVDGDAAGRHDPGRWGPYAAAVARWETLTRPAPAATDEGGKLRAEFVEWMQGLPPGWVTATPGLGRPAQLTALGNGVVPQQASKAIELLTPPFPRCACCRTG
ncbi:DNA cytosine methyltransferase [Kitasatospora sp. NPDC089509]|uniref:DNA cytosine methyltransferase n=1 Tax=Kitasatospora sp. NPDC089509 TaxID=3364079 RepID=UPI003800E5F5